MLKNDKIHFGVKIHCSKPTILFIKYIFIGLYDESSNFQFNVLFAQASLELTFYLTFARASCWLNSLPEFHSSDLSCKVERTLCLTLSESQTMPKIFLRVLHDLSLIKSTPKNYYIFFSSQVTKSSQHNNKPSYTNLSINRNGSRVEVRDTISLYI